MIRLASKEEQHILCVEVDEEHAEKKCTEATDGRQNY